MSERKVIEAKPQAPMTANFGRTKDKVAMVGFANSRDLAPFDDPDVEIWGLNEGYFFPWMKRWDRWFQIHQEWDFSRTNNSNHTNHSLWLKNTPGTCLACGGKGAFIPLHSKDKAEVPCPQCKATGTYTPDRRTDFPIYMQDVYPEIPGSVKFPLAEVTKKFMGGIDHRPYFRSTAAYMLTLAMYMGYTDIGVYGFEMGMDTEYHYQRPNFEYLVGVAHGMGINVHFPDSCPLLKGALYGFEESRVGIRQNFEIRKMVLEQQIKSRMADMMRAEGATQIVQELLQTPGVDLQEMLKKQAMRYTEAQGLYNFVRGAKLEVENLIAMQDKYFLGNTDAVEYKIREENVNVEYAQEA